MQKIEKGDFWPPFVTVSYSIQKLLATPIFVETSAHSTLYWKNISQFILQSFLKPTIRYELKHGDMLTFGDVKCQYVVDLDTEEVNCYMCTVRLV